MQPAPGGQGIFRAGIFDGQAVVVSGGGTGIGRAIARELARLGARVAICSRSAERLEPARAEIESAGGSVLALPCNIRDPESVAAFFAEVTRQWGPITGLVNNAGGQFLSPAEAITPKGWHAVVETNLTGTWYMSRAALDVGMREHGGAIVNIVMEMWRGYPGMAHSGAARAGVVNLTQSLALEWAPMPSASTPSPLASSTPAASRTIRQRCRPGWPISPRRRPPVAWVQRVRSSRRSSSCSRLARPTSPARRCVWTRPARSIACRGTRSPNTRRGRNTRGIQRINHRAHREIWT